MKWIFLVTLVVFAWRAVDVGLYLLHKRTKEPVLYFIYYLACLLLLVPIVLQAFSTNHGNEIEGWWGWLVAVVFLGPEIIDRLCGKESEWQYLWRHRHDPVWPYGRKQDEPPSGEPGERR
ncbi:MAG TPA: hypothetical protein VGM51_13330 [Armatimonadota bacterium]|jgi:hypothetical protein